MFNKARDTVTLIGIVLATGCHRGGSQEATKGAALRALLVDGGPNISGMLAGSGGKVVPSVTATNSEQAPDAGSILSKEAIAAVVNPQSMPEYTGPTGSVEGDVFVVGPDAPDVPDIDLKGCPGAGETFGKLFRAGAPVGTEDGQPKRPVADAIVVVTDYKGFVPSHSDTLSLVIGEKCELPSRTLTMTFGQRLKVGNLSTELFGPELSGVSTMAVRVAPPRQSGDPVELVPPRPGFYSMRDAFHSFFHVDLYVLPHPFHAVSDRRGHFRIDGIPVGKVTVNARLVAIARATQATTVPDAGHKAGRQNVSVVSDAVEVRTGEVSHTNLVLQYNPETAAPQPILPPSMP